MKSIAAVVTWPAQTVFMALGLSLLVSCGSDAVEGPSFSFPSGDFQISTRLVDDRCLDGGLNLLFMPRGSDQPWQWPYPVAIHAPSELPKTYDLTLREPFRRMTVTATQVDPQQQQFVAHSNPSVELGRERFGDCVVSLDGVVQVTLLESNRVEGIAALQMRNPRGDERCPAEMPASCEVILIFDGLRMTPR
jgi:hypothetical protein